MIIIIVIVIIIRGGDLGGTGGIVPSKVRWRGRKCFYPPIFRKCLADLQCKTNNNEKEDETHVTRDRHTSIILFHCLD